MVPLVLALLLAWALPFPKVDGLFHLPYQFSGMFSGYRIGDEYYDVCQDTCRLTMSCWMHSGQVVKGHLCGSPFHVCCAEKSHAEARKINPGWGVFGGATSTSLFPLVNSVEHQDKAWPELRYGPVVNEPECGFAKVSRRRVVGGSAAGFGTFPWQALIRIRNSRCGGALVSKRHVVTAGHCVHPLGNNVIQSKSRPVDGVAVYLGEYSLYNHREPLPRQKFKVDKIHLHPFYEFTPQADRYDVAVLKLDRPAVYDWHVRPVCLPSPRDVTGTEESSRPGTRAMVAGWGATRPDSARRPTELQAVDVKVVESRTCERWHLRNRINLRVYEDMMCAGHKEGGKDACFGDSGGPLMTRDPKSNRWTLIGLVSAGYSCAKPGQPGIYHKLSTSSDWISYVKTHL